MTGPIRPIADMTISNIVPKILEQFGIYVGPDATGMAWIVTDENGRKISLSGNEIHAYYNALNYMAVNKMGRIED